MTSIDSTSRVAKDNNDSDSSALWLDKNVGATLARVKIDLLQSVKELVRHGMFRSGLFSNLDMIRSMRGLRVKTGCSDKIDDRFKEIYERGLWLMDDGQESHSGTGSSRTATSGLVSALVAGMNSLDCKTLLDVGCGDWNWMRHEKFEFDYIGVDIVESVISSNQKFAGPRVRFELKNALCDNLPVVDMALCREVLFHLSFNDARKMLHNISCHATYVCATTDAAVVFNSDIPTGDFRPLNLLKQPFRLPQPQALIPDSAVRSGRFLGVWRSTTLLAALQVSA